MHPLARTDLLLMGMACVLGVQLALIAHALSANADARRRARRDISTALDRVDELEVELEQAQANQVVFLFGPGVEE